MNKLLLLLPLFLVASSCSTSMKSAADDPLAEAPEAGESVETESSRIEWYRDNIQGEFRNGKLFGYAKSPGSSTDWAFENASWQANANLKIWIDEQVELARLQLSEQLDDVSDREFILHLRVAVSSLDFPEAEIRSENYEEGETSYVIMRIEESPERVLESLGEHLNGWPDVWQKMTQSEPLSSW